MNQDKLEVVKQEMARVNIDILGISKLDWMNLTQMIITSITVGKNPEKKWSSPHSQQESKVQYLRAISKTPE